jgi:hypothetical protein
MKSKPNAANLKTQPFTLLFPGLCLLAASLMLAVGGCKPAADGNASLDPAGVYTLVSVDGKNVPCSLTHEGVALTVKSGVFTINADGTCRSQVTFTVPARGDMDQEVKATYTRHGAELTMQWERAGTTLGIVGNNTFTMTNEAMVFAYRK